jgi:hypothetical protein
MVNDIISAGRLMPAARIKLANQTRHLRDRLEMVVRQASS